MYYILKPINSNFQHLLKKILGSRYDIYQKKLIAIKEFVFESYKVVEWLYLLLNWHSLDIIHFVFIIFSQCPYKNNFLVLNLLVMYVLQSKDILLSFPTINRHVFHISLKQSIVFLDSSSLHLESNKSIIPSCEFCEVINLNFK